MPPWDTADQPFGDNLIQAVQPEIMRRPFQIHVTLKPVDLIPRNAGRLHWLAEPHMAQRPQYEAVQPTPAMSRLRSPA